MNSKRGRKSDFKTENQNTFSDALTFNLGQKESVFVNGCYNVEIEDSESNVTIGGVPISRKFRNRQIPVYCMPGFPSFEIAIASETHSKTVKTAVTLSPVKRFQNGIYCYQANAPQLKEKSSFLNPETELLNIDVYTNVCNAVLKTSRTASNDKETVVLISGEKNKGKSTFCNFLLNFMVNSLDSKTELRFCDLDVGRPAMDCIGHVSSYKVDEPLFINAPNTLIRLPSSAKDKLEFVGNNSISNVSDHYVSQVAKLFEREANGTQNKASLIYVVNTLGFTKGLGKAVSKSIEKLLPKRVIKVKLTKDSKVKVKDSIGTVVLIASLQSSDFKIKPPQFFQEQRSLSLGSFLFDNKSLFKAPISQLKFRILKEGEEVVYYKTVNSHLLNLLFKSSFVHIKTLRADGSSEVLLGVCLNIDPVTGTAVFNVPFWNEDSANAVNYAEVTKSATLEFNFERHFLKDQTGENDDKMPFLCTRLAGIGSKALRKKISKRKAQ